MTRTEDRLADALGAVAGGVPAETLRPLVAPPRAGRGPLARPGRRRGQHRGAGRAGRHGDGRVRDRGQEAHRAAAAGARRGAGRGAALLPGGRSGRRITVRSTATSRVTSTLPIRGRCPSAWARSPRPDGLFFAAGVSLPAGKVERVWELKLNAAGRVAYMIPVHGGWLAPGQVADGMAASPGGDRVAVSITTVRHGNPSGSDRIIVIDTKTGARTVWSGGTRDHGRNGLFGVASMSWTGDGQRLAVLGQWCPGSGGPSNYAETNIFCQGSGGQAHRIAEAWLIRPVSGGGLLSRGQLLLRQSDRYPYLAQALISPDGRVLTAMVLTGPVVGQNPGGDGIVPDNMTIRQIAVPSGRPLGVLYRRHLGSTFETGASPDFLGLTGDSTRQHWTVIAELGHDPFNGWLYRGRLVPLINVTGLNDPGFEAW